MLNSHTSFGTVLYTWILPNGPYLHSAYPPLFPFLQGLVHFFVPGTWLPGRRLALLGFWGCGVFIIRLGMDTMVKDHCLRHWFFVSSFTNLGRMGFHGSY